VRLERLVIAGFGRLRDLSLKFGDGLTVVYGPNESGKSTIVECIVRMLFGFPEPHHNKFRTRYEPWSGNGRFAATLAYRLDDGRTFEVTRDFARADVPTETVDAITRRPISTLTGNKSASPGEETLQIPLGVYRSAAVLSAGDIGVDETASHVLAERLAEIIGSAGDASAAEAIDRLEDARNSIGLTGANTPLGKASREADEAEADLRRFHEEQSDFAETIREQAALSERAHDLGARRSRCAAALAAVRLRSLRSRITEAAEAKRHLDSALDERGEVDAGSAAFERRDDVDAAIEAYRAAVLSEADATARSAARAADRAALQHDVDVAGNELMEKRAAVARFDEKLAAHEAAAKDRPAISAETLAALEREADEADAAESRARTLETAAAIARQRQRPSPVATIGAYIFGGALVAIWLVTHALGFALGGIALIALGILFGVIVSGANRRRSDLISNAQTAAEEAGELNKRATAALVARCRAIGCPSVAAVRAARTAQLEIEKVRVAREGASEAARILAQRRDVLVQRLDDVDILERDRRVAAAQTEERRRALEALLDELAIASGTTDERIAAYRRRRDADELAAHADAAAGNARAQLERALGGSTVEALEDEADRCAAQAAAGGDPGEFADRSESELTAELGALEAEQRNVERALDAARGRMSEFDRNHPVPVAELEERAAAAAVKRDHLRAVRQALETASAEIERVKDIVHSDFTPPLNEAVGKLGSAMTGGRYGQAWIDPADFTVRVRVPETATTQEAAVLSTGTLQQLQLALRAALATTLGNGERVPLLVDDALANADDGRAEAALLQAATLARSGQQIVFFTHREALEARASALVGVTVVRLDGPIAGGVPTPGGDDDHVRYEETSDSRLATTSPEAAPAAGAQTATAGTPPGSGLLPGF